MDTPRIDMQEDKREVIIKRDFIQLQIDDTNTWCA
jgi:hypothetical protein